MEKNLKKDIIKNKRMDQKILLKTVLIKKFIFHPSFMAKKIYPILAHQLIPIRRIVQPDQKHR